MRACSILGVVLCSVVQAVAFTAVKRLALEHFEQCCTNVWVQMLGCQNSSLMGAAGWSDALTRSRLRLRMSRMSPRLRTLFLVMSTANSHSLT